MHLSCGKVYQDGIGWERKHPYYEKSMSADFLGSPHTMGFAAFSCVMKN